MSQSLNLPHGILPKLSWLLQQLQRELSPQGPRLLHEEEVETMLEALEDDLIAMEPCLEPEPEDSPFRNMWHACEDILDSIVEAWQDNSAEMLEQSRDILARIYQELQSAEDLVEPKVCLDYVF
jgi:hypothetical protein